MTFLEEGRLETRFNAMGYASNYDHNIRIALITLTGARSHSDVMDFRWSISSVYPTNLASVLLWSESHV